MSSSNEVYCYGCQYLVVLEAGSPPITRCSSPNNQIENKTWFRIYTKDRSTPEEINKNNDCKWYEKKK